MNLSAPTTPIFIISPVLAILTAPRSFPFISGNAFRVVVIGYVVLLVGNLSKGL